MARFGFGSSHLKHSSHGIRSNRHRFRRPHADGRISGRTEISLRARARRGSDREAVARSGVAAEEVDEVIMGNVLPAGQGQAPARQAALGAGLPVSTGCTTINKVCGSGMKAAMIGRDLITLGSSRIMVTGGMESMSNAPYLLPKARGGLRLGHAEIKDICPGCLEDAYDPASLGTYAETGAKYGIARGARPVCDTSSCGAGKAFGSIQ